MTGMAGRLRLVVGLDGAGKCALREHYNSQLHRVLHLVPGDAPEEGVVYVLNPSGGIAQGDDLEADIVVESGAHAIVTSPAATKVYRAERGLARSLTRLRVQPGAVLEFLPEPVIPHAGARFLEELDLDVAKDGCALAWEILAPGRTARGERLQYDRLEFRVQVAHEGRPVLRERGAIVPAEGLSGPAVFSRFAAYGIFLVIGRDPFEIERALREITEGRCAGVSRLRGRGTLLKMLASETREIQDAFRRAREIVGPILSHRPATWIRRT